MNRSENLFQHKVGAAVTAARRGGALTTLDFAIILALTACGQSAASEKQEEIQSAVPKTDEREADLAYYTNGRADQEQNDSNVRPAISGGVENIDEYDTIILGYPIWHGQAPRIISTFLESYDFSGKTIIPFCTSHSSEIGSSASNLYSLCSESTKWMDGKRFESGVSKESLHNWMGEIGLITSF